MRQLPSREALMQVIKGISAALFPTHYGRPDLNDERIDFFVGDTLSVTLDRLVEQVRRGLRFTPELEDADEAVAHWSRARCAILSSRTTW